MRRETKRSAAAIGRAAVSVWLVCCAGCGGSDGESGRPVPAEVKQAEASGQTEGQRAGIEQPNTGRTGSGMGAGMGDGAVAGSTAPAQPRDGPGEGEAAKERFADPGAGALVQAGDAVYLYREADGAIERIGRPDAGAALSGLSPDGRLAALRYYSSDGSADPPQIGVYDLDAGDLLGIEARNGWAEQLMHVQWIDDGRLLAAAHVNPSAEAYMVYDAETGEELHGAVGLLFQAVGDGLLLEWSPHFSPDNRANVQYAPPGSDSGRVELYRTEVAEDDVVAAALSPDGTRLAFWTLRGEASFVSAGQVDLRNGAIGEPAEYDAAPLRAGSLSVDNGGNPTITADGRVYRPADGKFVDAGPVPSPEAPAIEPGRFEQLREAMRASLGTDGAERIEWFGIG